MAKVGHFEITADDPERASKFYTEVFGWEIQKWDGPEDYWLAETGDGEGIDGAIMRRAHNQAVINTINVEDLDTMADKVDDAGGDLIGELQDIPGVGRFGYFKDSEGNVFGMMQQAEDSD